MARPKRLRSSSRTAASGRARKQRPARQQAAFSKVSVKSQTVLPRAVRERLNIQPGDTLRYRITDDGILIDKSPAGEGDDPFASFTEWSSPADEKAYADL
jgi:AbrB family looped-hinge helix DNA binding protein